jgi:hypothetical protein
MIKRGIKATNERRTITLNAVIRHVMLRSNAVIRQTDGEMAQQTTFMTSVFMNVVVGELTAVREDTSCQHTDRESELQGDRTELHAQHKADADHFK